MPELEWNITEVLHLTPHSGVIIIIIDRIETITINLDDSVPLSFQSQGNAFIAYADLNLKKRIMVCMCTESGI